MEIKKVVLKINNTYEQLAVIKGVSYSGKIVNKAEIDAYVYKIGDKYSILVPTGKPTATMYQIKDYLRKGGYNTFVEAISSQFIVKAVLTAEEFDYLTDTPKNVYVDGWTSGNPGLGGYIITDIDKNVLFKKDYDTPHTNNFYELAAIARAVKEYSGRNVTIYSDSVTAISWSKGNMGKEARKKYSSDAEMISILNFLEEHKEWIEEHLVKWQTSDLGEIPADPGRKK